MLKILDNNGLRLFWGNILFLFPGLVKIARWKAQKFNRSLPPVEIGGEFSFSTFEDGRNERSRANSPASWGYARRAPRESPAVFRRPDLQSKSNWLRNHLDFLLILGGFANSALASDF